MYLSLSTPQYTSHMTYFWHHSSGFCFADYRPELTTYKQYMRRVYEWTDTHLEAEKKRVAEYQATIINGMAPLPEGIEQDRKSAYFEPIQNPVWEYERVMFDADE
jgi:hypothetical protein